MNQYSADYGNGVTAGLDLGDKYSFLCVVDNKDGRVIEEKRIKSTSSAMAKYFSSCKRMRIAMETGTHSPWLSRLLKEQGHEVVVANARELRWIYKSKHKNDRADAEKLALLARFDQRLLSPVHHRSEAHQSHLAILQAREGLVKARTNLINQVRGLVKAQGARLKKCSTEAFANKVRDEIPEGLQEALLPLIEMIASLTERIKGFDKRIKELCEKEYSHTELLRQVKGVGVISALAFVLILEDPERFDKSRSVGAYLGLTPGGKQSGEQDIKLRITKQGNDFLRKLLVQCSHYLLGPFGEDCDLKRYGQKLAASGGEGAKKRAVVAVARKLSVLLHHLWVTGLVYEPLYQHHKKTPQQDALKPAA